MHAPFFFPAAPAAAPTNSPEPSYAGATDTYAVVDIGGHQLIVEEGRWYTVNRLEVRYCQRCVWWYPGALQSAILTSPLPTPSSHLAGGARQQD